MTKCSLIRYSGKKCESWQRIFDEDGSGDVDHKELGVGLEILKNNTFEDKLDSIQIVPTLF